jgi:hypothetical protein
MGITKAHLRGDVRTRDTRLYQTHLIEAGTPDERGSQWPRGGGPDQQRNVAGALAKQTRLITQATSAVNTVRR